MSVGSPERQLGSSTPDLSWERVRTTLLLMALVLSPLSYTIKTVYGFGFTWVDPTLVIGAAAALLPRWSWPVVDRRIRTLGIAALLFLGTYWLSASRAAALARFPDSEPYREPIRTLLAMLLGVGCIRVMRTPSAVRRASIVLGWTGVVEVIAAIYLLASLALPLPLPEAWQSYVLYYWAHQSIWAGEIVWPRLGGTFVEAPPFGLYVLGVLIVLRLGRRVARRHGAPMPGRWMDGVLLLGLIGSLSTQVLAGAALWGILIVGHRLWSRQLSARTRWLYMAGGVVLLCVLGAGAYYKYATGTRTDREYGTSVGERRAHAASAWRIFDDDPVLGIGPGQFGQVEWRRSYGLYDVRVSPLSVFHEILADAGAVGLGAASLFVGCLLLLLLRTGHYWELAAAMGLLAADAFQGNWRWPIVFICLGTIVAASLSSSGAPSAHTARSEPLVG